MILLQNIYIFNSFIHLQSAYMTKSTEWSRVHEKLSLGHVFKRVHVYYGIRETSPCLQDTSTERIVSQINSLHIFRETLRSIQQSNVCIPDGVASLPTEFSTHFYLSSSFSVPPIVSSLNIFGEVYNFLLLPSVNMTIFKVKWLHYGTSWYFAKSFVRQAHHHCYLQLM
jgi:hypothetical protein